jgi:molybdopterin synthase sulfur carrier subunit
MTDDADGSTAADAGATEATELELRFFATFREAVGRKEIDRRFDVDATVGDVLAGIEAEFPELVGELLDGDGDIQPQLSVLKNGREVVHLDGTATELDDGDRLSVFPPVAGG